MENNKTYSRKNAELVRNAFLATSTALQNIAPDGSPAIGDDTFIAEGVELAIASWRGKEVEMPQVDSYAYQPETSKFVLQIIDGISGDMIDTESHKSLVSALYSLSQQMPLDTIRAILWVNTTNGYQPMFDTVHAECQSVKHLHIDQVAFGEDTWLHESFLKDEANGIGDQIDRTLGVSLSVWSDENEKDGHFASFQLTEIPSHLYSNPPETVTIFEVIVMLTPTDEEIDFRR